MKVNSYPLETLPGLETTYEQHLATLGIHTTVDLCRQGQSDQQQQVLAQTLRVPQRYITKWVVLAELSRVPGVGCQFCGVLLHSGISSRPVRPKPFITRFDASTLPPWAGSISAPPQIKSNAGFRMLVCCCGVLPDPDAAGVILRVNYIAIP
jgi:hypothetical protein